MNNVKENVLKDKSYSFTVNIVRLCRKLSKSNKEYVLINQLLKAGTSIGANVREAEFAQSRPDFTNKMSIALKEANETEYWLLLLNDTDIISEEEKNALIQSLTEIIRILISTVKTSKK